MLMPNVPTNTLGGECWWKTGKVKNGWRLQKNIVTQHYRILDRYNRRHAWTLNRKAAFEAFERLSMSNLPY